MTDYRQFPSPCYVVDEARFRRNLALIQSVAQSSGAEIILAFKAFALWKLFPIVREYIGASTASSLAEARLAYEEMGAPAHTFAPVYREAEFDAIAACSSHITFNSLAQYTKYAQRCRQAGISCGLRCNPELSLVETDLYNPCVQGSRLGVPPAQLPDRLPEGIEGLHFHCLCESSAADSESLIARVEERFGQYLPALRWVNFGGGHLMTREGYEVDRLVDAIRAFRSRHPHLRVILEPGSAFAWRVGELVSTVQDVVKNGGVRTAMLDVSFACHMPDCLEMPYQPSILGAKPAEGAAYVYRMGGNSCLSGDYVGDWGFDAPLQAGDRIVFEDMIHYTTVKTLMFNGVSHPSIGVVRLDGRFELLRSYSYEDYKNRMD